jgi:hypothetical protein
MFIGLEPTMLTNQKMFNMPGQKKGPAIAEPSMRKKLSYPSRSPFFRSR